MKKSITPNTKKTRRAVSCILFCVGCLLIGLSFWSIRSGIDSFSHLRAYAQESGNSLDETMVNVSDFLQGILKLLYLVMRPLLVIAGNALDNTFVYGEFLHLDAPLYMIRNICKNFANFALAFFVLFEIFKFVFYDGEDKSVKDVLKNALIAGIGIQVSWFVIGALIDLSTVATYAIGGLPMTMMKETKVGQHPIMGVNTIMDLGNGKSTLSDKSSYIIYYTRGKINFSPCAMYKNFILGKQYDGNESTTTVKFDEKRCVYNTYMMVNIQDLQKNNPVRTEGAIAGIGDKIDTLKKGVDKLLTEKAWDKKCSYTKADGTEETINGNCVEGIIYTKYSSDGTIALNNTTINEQNTDTENAIKLSNYNVKLLQDLKGKDGESYERAETFAKCANNVNNGGAECEGLDGAGTFVEDLLTESRGFVGPLVTLYVSLMNFSDLHVSSVGGGGGRTTYATFFEFLLKTVTGFLLIFPLLTLAIVLVVRLGYMWLVIALSPLLVIYGTFKEKIGDTVKLPGGIDGISTILGVIFYPVIPVFALSISLLFLFTLQDSFYDQEHSKVWDGLGIEIVHKGGTTECLNAWGLFETCYDVGNNHQGGGFYVDFFARLIMNAFGIGLVWAILFVAIKGAAFSKDVAQKIQDVSTSAISSIPFIPTTQGFISAGSAGKFLDPTGSDRNSILNKVGEKFENEIETETEGLNNDYFAEGTKKGENTFANTLNSNPDADEALKNAQADAKDFTFDVNTSAAWNNIPTKWNQDAGTENDVDMTKAKTAVRKQINSLINAGNGTAVVDMINNLDESFFEKDGDNSRAEFKRKAGAAAGTGGKLEKTVKYEGGEISLISTETTKTATDEEKKSFATAITGTGTFDNARTKLSNFKENEISNWKTLNDIEYTTEIEDKKKVADAYVKYVNETLLPGVKIAEDATKAIEFLNTDICGAKTMLVGADAGATTIGKATELKNTVGKIEYDGTVFSFTVA